MDFFFFVATLEIGTPECVRLVQPARAVEEAVRLDQHLDVSNHRDANRSEVFLLRPSTFQLSRAPRPHVAQTLGRVGSIWGLAGCNEFQHVLSAGQVGLCRS